jgi:hypothetical protein
MKQLLILFHVCVFSIGFGQNKVGFSGKLVYSVHVIDSLNHKEIPAGFMTIYTNDTLLRIENLTPQLGLQVLIKHLVFNKSYLLIQTANGNYAIQTDHASEKVIPNPYVYKKGKGRKKIAGLLSRSLIVCDTTTKEKLKFYYYKNMFNNYLNMNNSYPGLLTEYYIKTDVGYFKYRLVVHENLIPEKDLFGIPSSYRKISFNDFMHEIMKHNPE